MDRRYEDESIYQLLPQQQPVMAKPAMYRSKVKQHQATLQPSMENSRTTQLTLSALLTFYSTLESSQKRAAAGGCGQQQQWEDPRYTTAAR
jgi:hypothetical protein